MVARDRKPNEQEPREEGFLGRWSRRKAEAREADAKEAEERELVRAEPAATAPEPSEPEEIDPKDLPDIESLTKESDFTVFMRKGVPEELRRQALRKLWRSDPVLANLDGLLEYGEDYSQIGRGGETVRTAYQVGRGFARKLEEIAADEQVEPAGARAEPAETAADAPPAESAHAEADQAPSAQPEPPAEPEADQVRPASAGERPAAGHPSVKSKPRRRLPRRG